MYHSWKWPQKFALPLPPITFFLINKKLDTSKESLDFRIENLFSSWKSILELNIADQKPKIGNGGGEGGIIDSTVGRKEYYHIIKITITSNLIRIFLGIEFGVEIFICCSTRLLTKWSTCQMLSLTVLRQQISVRMDLYLLIQYISVLVLLCSFEYTIS